MKTVTGNDWKGLINNMLCESDSNGHKLTSIIMSETMYEMIKTAPPLDEQIKEGKTSVDEIVGGGIESISSISTKQIPDECFDHPKQCYGIVENDKIELVLSSMIKGEIVEGESVKLEK